MEANSDSPLMMEGRSNYWLSYSFRSMY